MREPLINIAINAARSAGNLIIRAMQRMDTVKISEKQPNDFVTEVDQRVEREIIQIIRKAYPSHSILGEEGGEQAGDDYKWVIDPIDGTRNFIHGVPHFATSIALFYRNKIEYGVVYDPIRQELFSAARGKGAYLNDTRIRVSNRKALLGCLIGFGNGYRLAPEKREVYDHIMQNVSAECPDLRRAGAASLDLAYVASGRLDASWDMDLKPWDIAAGVLLVKEAGGLVTDPFGGEDYMQTGDIVAANSHILKKFLKVSSLNKNK